MFIIIASRSCFSSISKLGSVSRTTLVMPSKYFKTSSKLHEKLYSDKHEWVELLENSTDHVKVGITKYAADALGDVVYAQLPEAGDVFEAGDECGALESVKAASEIYSPVSGTVSTSNKNVEDKPGLINTNTEEAGWLFQLQLTKLDQLDGLMSKQQYEKFLQSVTDDLHN